MKERILFSTDWEEELGTANEVLDIFNEWKEVNDEEENKTEFDNEVYDFIYREINERGDDFFNNLIDTEDILAIADIGRWDGRYPGGDVGNLKELLKRAVNEEDYFKVLFDKTLRLKTANHDGTSYFTFYKLTQKGKQWYENNYRHFSRQKAHEHLMKTKGYIRNLTLQEVSNWF